MNKKSIYIRIIIFGLLLSILVFLKINKTYCGDYKKYYDKGDYNKAIKVINKCLKNKSIDDNNKFDLYLKLQDSYSKIENYDKIDIVFLDELSRNDSVGDVFLYKINNIRMQYYADQMDYAKAIELGEGNVCIAKKINKEKSEQYDKLLGLLAHYYAQTGGFNKSIDLLLESLTLNQEIYGENSTEYLRGLNNLAVSYSETGNYKKSIELGNKVLDLVDESKKEDCLISAAVFSNMMSSYINLGNYNNATEYGRKYLALIENETIEDEDVIANALHNLSILYSDIGDLEEAIRLEEKAESLIKKNNKNTFQASLICTTLSTYYAETGKYKKALRKSKEALQFFKDKSTFNYDPSNYAISLSNLGSIYAKNNDFVKAIDFQEQSLNVLRENELTYKPFYSSLLFNLGINYLGINKGAYAAPYVKEGTDMLEVYINTHFKWLSESERSMFWNKENIYFLIHPSFYYSTNDPSFVDMSFDGALLSKGLLLQSSQELNNLLMESGNRLVVEKVEKLRSLHQTLNKLYEKPISERLLNTDSLEIEAQDLEKDLLFQSKEYGDYTRFMSVKWADVQKGLSEKDVAIEFVDLPVFYSDSTMYAALVLRKDWGGPRMISLFEKKEVEQYLNHSPNKLYSGDVGIKLYQLMWKPLEEVIQKGDVVHFSAAGVYHQLALEYLQSEDGTPLCDIYNFHRLSSTRQLALDDIVTSFENATLYGGIQYDVNPQEMLVESNKFQVDENLHAYRGISMDSLRGNKWISLDNTIKEIDFISDELSRNQIKTALFTGTNANEESIKALSGKKTNLLHLATHGFFLPIEEARKVDYFQMIDRDDNPTPDMSMRRSGLIMAGGNRAWSGDTIPEEVDDGILTAQEISVLDFREMELVVLSACETGLGDINTSEGVFGLQRAFKKAGAKTLIMSLWKVNDEVTKSLMNKFYQSLLSGKTKHEAFLEAQQFIRSRHPEPQNWAAFIMLD